jgi:hypothetical protein
MRVRLDAVHAAVSSRCRASLTLPDGRQSCFPLIMVAEAAVAAQQGKTEGAWREAWIRTLISSAVDENDDAETDRVARVLAAMRPVIEELKYGRVWPWLGSRRRRGKKGGRNGSQVELGPRVVQGGHVVLLDPDESVGSES